MGSDDQWMELVLAIPSSDISFTDMSITDINSDMNISGMSTLVNPLNPVMTIKYQERQGGRTIKSTHPRYSSDVELALRTGLDGDSLGLICPMDDAEAIAHQRPGAQGQRIGTGFQCRGERRPGWD